MYNNSLLNYTVNNYQPVAIETVDRGDTKSHDRVKESLSHPRSEAEDLMIATNEMKDTVQ